MWPPICPHVEPSSDQAMVVMVTIFNELGTIKIKKTAAMYELVPNASFWTMHQYGGNILSFLCYLQQTAHIGKESYVEVMTKTYNWFGLERDYLHGIIV